MSLIATITPSKTLTATTPVSYSDLNTGFNPTCALSGNLSEALQATFGVTRYATLDISVGATPVAAFAGVTSKTIRCLRVAIIRTGTITAGSAVRLVVRTAAASPVVIGYALLSDIASNVMLPETSITFIVTAMGAAMTSGSGIEIVSADASNVPINGTSGTLVAAVTAIYE